MDKRDREDSHPHGTLQPDNKRARMDTLWLDTVRRDLLDFDFEKLCSVSLTNVNVYACLVCGKYFQGRGKTSYAYLHSVHDDHHVFINLASQKIYVLPDGYEVLDTSLNDIKYILDPSFTPGQAEATDVENSYRPDLSGKLYLPGYVGLNNVKANDYINVVVQSLSQVVPLRKYFLVNKLENSGELVKRFGMLLRKIWNPKAFKGHVSPHEFIQQVASSSQKKFPVGEQKDAADLLTWFLNELHVGLGGKKAAGSSIIHRIFQGQVKVEIQRTSAAARQSDIDVDREIKTSVAPFLFLSLDLPPSPLFQDELERNIIPQVPIADLLAKYDGSTVQETTDSLRRYKIQKLPLYLILVVKRFLKNNFVSEKNPTIVTFPIKGLDMSDYVEGPDLEKQTRYDLIANICHEGRVGQGSYKVDTYCQPKDQWFRIQDLFVEEVMAQMVLLSESCIQIWRRR